VFFFTPYDLFIAADPLRHSPGFLSSMSLWVRSHAPSTACVVHTV